MKGQKGPMRGATRLQYSKRKKKRRREKERDARVLGSPGKTGARLSLEVGVERRGRLCGGEDLKQKKGERLQTGRGD